MTVRKADKSELRGRKRWGETISTAPGSHSYPCTHLPAFLSEGAEHWGRNTWVVRDKEKQRDTLWKDDKEVAFACLIRLPFNSPRQKFLNLVLLYWSWFTKHLCQPPLKQLDCLFFFFFCAFYKRHAALLSTLFLKDLRDLKGLHSFFKKGSGCTGRPKKASPPANSTPFPDEKQSDHCFVPRTCLIMVL